MKPAVTEYTVVEKEQLSDFESYKRSLGMLLGVTIASFVIGIVTSNTVAYFLGAVWAIATVFIWYLEKESFPHIREAIKDTRGGEQ